MGLKDFYLSLEDKYYDLIEKTPLTKLTDKIDQVIPSFALLIGLIILIVLLAGYILIGVPLVPQKAVITLTVQDEVGNIVENADVRITYNGEVLTLKTNEFGRVEFEVPLESELSIKVSKEGFEEALDSLKAVSLKISYSIPILTKEELAKRIIMLQAQDGSLLDGVPATIRFSCSNRGITAPSPVTTASGIVEVAVPLNCGKLMAAVTARGFESADSIELAALSNPVELEATPPETGMLKVYVADEKGNDLEGIKVSLYTADGAPSREESTHYGLAVFEELLVGSYYALLSDPLNKFSSKRSEVFTVTKNHTTTVTVELSQVINASLAITVQDKKSKAVIANALIELLQNDSVVDSQRSNNKGKAQFSLADLGAYTLRGSHADYFFGEKEIEIAGGDNNENLLLEKVTPENSGRVKVKVLDEDNKPVERAKVSIYDAETDFLVPLNQSYYTDANGEVNFKGLKAKTYYFLASKYPVQAQSDDITIKLKELNEVEIQMVIGDGQIDITAVDEDYAPLAFATATVYSETGTELGSFELDALGRKSFTTKADKKVFIRVSKDGYSSYTSALFQVYPNRIVTIPAQLQKTILGDKPSLTFLGLFESEYSQEKIDVVSAGKRYQARLQLIIPSGLDLEEAGIFFRAGEEILMQNDKIYIKRVNAPNASVMRGTSFNAPNGWATDSTNITESEAKWANIVLENPLEGIYNVSLEVSIKRDTVPGKRLPFFYRAWGLENGKFLRDPLDAELGASESTSAKGELYAFAYEKDYWESLEEACTADFCYAGEKVFDTINGLYLEKRPYNVLVFAPNILSFEISNNSDKVYTDAVLTITNVFQGQEDSMLKITDYSLQNADAQVFSAARQEIFKIEEIPLGYFTRGKALKAEISFEPQEVRSSEIELKIVSQGSIIFSEEIPFKGVKSNVLSVEVEPETIFAFTPTELKVTTKDDQDNPVEGVKVFVTPGETKLTGSNGIATINFPVSSPGTKVVIKAEKPGYQATPLEMAVEGKIVEFDPESLRASLQAIGRRTDIQAVEITNLTAAPVKIFESSLSVSPKFRRLIDFEETESFSDLKLINITLESNEPVDKEVLKVSLREEIRVEDIEPETLEGKLLIYFRNEELGKVWVNSLPFTVDIGIGAGVLEQKCIYIENPQWDAVTLEEVIDSDKIYIRNKCKSQDERPVELKNLSLKLIWKSDDMADITVNLKEIPSQDSFSSTLLRNEETVYFPLMKNYVLDGTEYAAVINFNPKPGFQSESADFTIKVSAEIETDVGLQKVEAEEDITGKIKIANLFQCIKVEPRGSLQEPLYISSENQETEFTVDAKECGDIKMDIEFCSDDPEHLCRGGTIEGGLELLSEGGTPLTVKREVQAETFTVRVKRREWPNDVPGIYEIPIEVLVEGRTYSEPWDSVYVVSEISEEQVNDYFYIESSQFNIPLHDSQAEYPITLYNAMVTEPVRVRADLCAWRKVTKKETGNAFQRLIKAARRNKEENVARAWKNVWNFGEDFVDDILEWLNWRQDCHDKKKTYTLLDFVINLPGFPEMNQEPDAKEILIKDLPEVKAEWDLDTTDYFSRDPTGEYALIDFIGRHYLPEGVTLEEELQSVGVIFENTGLEEPYAYSVVEFTATEHLHGDLEHDGDAYVNCGRHSSFGMFNIRDPRCGASEKTYSQKFHLRFETTAREQPIPVTEFDKYGCKRGALVGNTDENAVPKILLNWNWEAIEKDSCDESNPNAVYCDATQFSIMLSRRIHQLDEFLKENDFQFDCPEDATAGQEEENNAEESRMLPVQTVGMTKLETNFSPAPNDLQAITTITNDLQESAYVEVKIQLRELEEDALIDECVYSDQEISAQSEEAFDCLFSNLSSGSYYIKASASSAHTSFSDWEAMIPINVFDEPLFDGCLLPRTTAFTGGVPMLAYFIQEDQTITWTSEITSLEDLTKLLKFNAFLIRDGFSEDFKSDFAESKRFLDAPTWFDSEQEERGLDSFFKSENLAFKLKYTENAPLPLAGLYDVELVIDFADDWDLFDNEGKPKAKISVIFNHLRQPQPDSPFYYLPFDGLVGQEGSVLERQGYGLQYLNENEPITLGKDPSFKTLDSPESNALFSLTTRKRDDLLYLNSTPETRGNILYIERGNDSREMVFSPSYATPVLMKLRHGLDEEKFSGFYSIIQDLHPIGVGNRLTQWQGYGNCLDFSGKPVWQEFNYKWDRAATSKDLPEWTSVYAVDWEKSFQKGSVFLRTIFYTPRNKDNALTVIAPLAYMNFWAPNAGTKVNKSSVSLNGIQGMEYNAPGKTINSLEAVLDLVAEGKACLTDNGLSARFWWNPKAVYEEESILTEKSLEDMQAEIENECIPLSS